MTRRLLLDRDAPKAIAEVYGEMRDRALAKFAEIGLCEDLLLNLVADMRFVGQAFEVPVDIDPAELDGLTVERLRAIFAAAHQRIFFHGAGGDKPVEAVSFRLRVSAPVGSVPVRPPDCHMHYKLRGSKGIPGAGLCFIMNVRLGSKAAVRANLIFSPLTP